MQRVERRQGLQRLCQQRQGARVTLPLAERLPAAGQPLFDLADLAFGGAHHAIDQRQPVFFQNAPPRHHPALDQRRQQALAILLRPAFDPVIQRPVAEPGCVDDVARGRAFRVHLPRA